MPFFIFVTIKDLAHVCFPQIQYVIVWWEKKEFLAEGGVFSLDLLSYRRLSDCVFHDSNSVRGIPDCRMMDCKVPILISRWSGTGTVMVPIDCFFCITIWLPLLRTSLKPCFYKIAHTSLPERIRSLPNGDLDLCHKNVPDKSTVYFLGRSCLKK